MRYSYSTGLHQVLILLCILSVAFSCEEEDRLIDNIILDKMLFYNSTLEELNAVEILAYKKGSNFEKLKDPSYFVLEYEDSEDPYYVSFYGYFNKEIDPDFDYRILFTSVGDTCEITDINVVKYGSVWTGYSRSFDGYYVNGHKFACQIIKVFPKHNYR